ncbi:MAG: hydrolase [Firmicutes bacterium]|nr:hydrolase [Bacillota bacterium]
MEPTITVTTAEKTFIPLVTAPAQWTTVRRGSPGRLTFSMLWDERGEMTEGAAVRLSAEGRDLFFGYVFSVEKNKESLFVTCYDQIRYLKNKDTYIYENKTAAQLLRMIAADFGLKTGEISDTNYQIPYRIEENTTLLDMIENALDITCQNTGESYVLFDGSGGLCLKNIKEMRVKRGAGYLVLDEGSGEDYRFSSSIDKGCYNQIKLSANSAKNGRRDVYMLRDGVNAGRWGVLQYYGELKEEENGRAKAETLLKLYNGKHRGLKLTGVFGAAEVRAGSVIVVRLDLGSEKLNRFMTVERAVHKFGGGEYFMDLTLTDGDFSA